MEGEARRTTIKIVEGEQILGEEPTDPPTDETPRRKKKKKLTKAEKKALKLKRAQDFKMLEMRDELRRELELSKRSAKKGKDVWEEWCTEIKITELRQELHDWYVRTERVMEKKDEHILMLLDDLENTREMHERNFAKQMQIMDYFIDVLNTLVESSRQTYEMRCTELLQEFFEEMNEKTEHEDFLKLYCENIMFTTNVITEDKLKTDYQIYTLKKDDTINTEIEKRYQLRNSVVSKMWKLHRQFVEFKNAATNTTLDAKKYERISALMERQRNFVIESAKLNDLEFRYTRLHSDLQRDILHKEVEVQHKLNDLRLEMAYFIQVRKSIEENMELDRKITFDKLRILTSESFKVLKRFRRLKRYGELLLALFINCRKYETEEEKVYPPDRMQRPNALQDVEENFDLFKVQILDLAKHVDISEEDVVKQMNTMKHFWRRQALIEAQNMALEEEKRTLTEENKVYVDFIRSLSKSKDHDLLKYVVHMQNIMPTRIVCPVVSRKKGRSKR